MKIGVDECIDMYGIYVAPSLHVRRVYSTQVQYLEQTRLMIYLYCHKESASKTKNDQTFVVKRIINLNVYKRQKKVDG